MKLDFLQNWLNLQTNKPIVVLQWKNVYFIRFGIVSAIALFFGISFFILMFLQMGISHDIIESLMVYTPINLILFSFVQSFLFSFREIIKDFRYLKNITFGFFGGLFGVVLTFLFFSQKYNLDTWKILDGGALLAGFIHGYARTACLNYGCCHGKIIPEHNQSRLHLCYTNPLSKAVRVSQLQNQPLYPVQMYESFGCFTIGIGMLLFFPLVPYQGLLAGLYILCYGILRFVCEFYRGEVDTPFLGKYSVYQWVSLFLMVLGFGLVLYLISLGQSNTIQFTLEKARGIQNYIWYILFMPLTILFFYGFHYKKIGKWC
jgi:prolipoprotein diacylglyceryltransferase